MGRLDGYLWKRLTIWLRLWGMSWLGWNRRFILILGCSHLQGRVRARHRYMRDIWFCTVRRGSLRSCSNRTWSWGELFRLLLRSACSSAATQSQARTVNAPSPPTQPTIRVQEIHKQRPTTSTIQSPARGRANMTTSTILIIRSSDRRTRCSDRDRLLGYTSSCCNRSHDARRLCRTMHCFSDKYINMRIPWVNWMQYSEPAANGMKSSLIWKSWSSRRWSKIINFKKKMTLYEPAGQRINLCQLQIRRPILWLINKK